MTRKTQTLLSSLFLYQALCIFLLAPGESPSARAQTSPIDWDRVAKARPSLKVMILVEEDRPISLGDLDLLATLGMVPADRDPGLVLGLRRAVFSTRIKDWKGGRVPGHFRLTLLDRFLMSGIYRIGFRVEEKGYRGPLSLEITGPRDGFGKHLLQSESTLRPSGEHRVGADEAGNRWLLIDYPQVREGETIHIQFAFKYRVDMETLLKHDILLADRAGEGPLPEEARRFLHPGHKIDPELPQAVMWTRNLGLGPALDARSEYLRLEKYVQETIRYDKEKRSQYFGGRAVYSNLDDMYQDVPVTLSRRIGACPDTSLVECAFLRARGIPCRTAGRFGHFFTDLYVPGQGWMSTSIHPTGIPLFVAPGPDHIPYQKWRPAILLKTGRLETKIRIEAMEGFECR